MNKYGDLIQSIEDFALIAMADKVYGPYLRDDGRQIVIIKDDNGGSRTVSWPKYLMEQHLGRQLDPDAETVDHINRNKDDNDLNNLRLVPRNEHSRDDTRRVKLVKSKCSMCDKEFERSPRLMRDKNKKGRRGIFCSRRCAGRYSRKLQLGLIEKFPVQPHVESEYYRNIKKLESLANIFEIKYADTLTKF